LALEIGSSIGDYRLIKAIGSGACGEVFQAEHTITRRVDAIKLLARRLPGPENEDQILREIEIQARLQHPNIAAVHNAFRVPEGLALVMELIEGEPLSAILDRDAVPLSDGTRYVLVTLDALAYAHERRVVHRDVKPSNILITPQGSVKLTDFGLARSLDEGQPDGSGIPAGSPYYMSPEQVVGNAADARSDCYSVGVILFELATGQKPFQGDTAFEIMLQQRNAVPAPPLSLQPGIGAELNGVILKALEKDPARRFQSAAEFRRALELALANCPALQQNVPASPSRRRVAIGRWAAAVAVAGLVLSSAALIPSLRRRPVATDSVSPAPPAPPPIAPAAVPPVPAPEEAAPEEEPVVTEPKPDMPVAGSPGRPRGNRAPVRPRPEPTAEKPVSVPPEAAGRGQAEDPAEVTTAPSPVSGPAPAAPADPGAQHAPAESASHDVAPAEPAKRPGLLRRAFGRIAKPFSKKPDPDPQKKP
jgi:serine/threonine-protein kinase